uniref:Bestrophin homolog n=1 Tax=Heligmosomoides polygyrus TaxID=6339 RepID=A0A183GV60_HELPZ
LRDIPLDFMLGFFVSVIVTRWSTLFNNIGLIEKYCVVAQLLAFRDISIQVRKRFPTIDAVVASGRWPDNTTRKRTVISRLKADVLGFLMDHERDALEGLNCAAANMGKHGCLYGKTWIPVQWAITLMKKARYEDETISSDILYAKCLEELRRFRTNLLTLTNYDWVPIPIMYPQLVFLAVHLFFFIALFSRQFEPSETQVSVRTPHSDLKNFRKTSIKYCGC